MSEKRTGFPSIDKPWLNLYSAETINAEVPECTIFEFLERNNRDYPQDIAIDYLGREITYKALFENIDQTAKAFAAAGVKKGDIVTVALPSIPEALYCVYALNKLGAIANMVHPLAGHPDLVFYLNEVGSEMMVLFDATYQILKDFFKDTKVKRAVVVSAGESMPFVIKKLYSLKNKKLSLPNDGFAVHWQSFIQAGANTPLPKVKKDPATTAVISHTGGTTGSPKGCMCSDNNYNSMIVQIGHLLNIQRKERQLAVLPPFINYSLCTAMLEPIALGTTCILLPKYEPEKFYEYAKKYKPNYVTSIPPYWEALLTLEKPKNLDLSFLRMPVYGGEAMAPQNEAAVNEILHSLGVPNPMSKGLGMTELISAATLTSFDGTMTDSVGAPLPKVNCMISDPDTGKELPYNTEGEICFSGPTVMIGYCENQEATDDLIQTDENGVCWLHTGDLGRLDERGVLRITGRIKRILMTKGKDGNVTKLFPVRIENVVNEHPSVRVSCVIGIPDEERVNYPRAIVELNDGVTPSDALANDIKRFCAEHLPDYSLPDEVVFTDALPRTSRGKIDYRALEKEVQQ